MPRQEIVAASLLTLPSSGSSTPAYRTLLNVTAHGILTGLGVANGTNYHSFRVTIDGHQVVEDILCGTSQQRVNNGMTIGSVFDSNLIVEVVDNGDQDSLPRYWAAWREITTP